MKAVVFHEVGDIRLDEVPEPRIEAAGDAIVRLTSSAICGTDLHFVRGTMAGMVPGTILGHEGVGVVEKVGAGVKDFAVGDRVVIPSTIACGACEPCREEHFAQCDRANPNGRDAGTAFYGGPAATGPFQGLQAEKARVPFADANLVALPPSMTDDQAILLSDIFPTAYFGAKLAGVGPGKTVAVFGCGPVGLFAVASAKLLGASRIFAVDTIPSRLAQAKAQGDSTVGVEAVDYNAGDPVAAIKKMTEGRGVDCVIDAVGVDANHPSHGVLDHVLSPTKAKEDREFKKEVAVVAPVTNPKHGNWIPGDGPSQVNRWSVEVLKKVGTLGIIGVYPPNDMTFPIGAAMNKNITMRMGNCNHRKYIPELIALVVAKKIDPAKVLSHHAGMGSAVDAYEAFDKREEGWIKVALEPSAGKGLVSGKASAPV